MHSTTLDINTIAHIAFTQPDLTLDCSQVYLTVHENNQTTRLRTICLVPIPTGPLLMLQCTPFEDAQSGYIFVYAGDRYSYSFCIQCENPEDNPILQAVPRTPLYPHNNSLELTKTIPVDPPYFCSQEETHQLLQIHIPDLPPEVIQDYPVVLLLTHQLTWPKVGQEQFYTAFYSVPGVSSGMTNIGRHPVNTKTKGSMWLYRLRNSIILYTLLPALRPLCSWFIHNGTITQALKPQHNLLLPDPSGDTKILVSPCQTPTDPILMHPSEALVIDRLLPPEQSDTPRLPGPSIADVDLRIRTAIQQAQALQLTC